MDRPVVTIFGGSGFLGRHVVRRLAARGWQVHVGVRDVEGAGFLKPMGSVGQIVPWPADVTDPESVRAATAGAWAVINLVGILYERGARTFQRIHVDGARTVAEAAAAAGAEKLVHVSALGADENSESDYARTKALGEQAVRQAFPDATVLRPSVVFGPEDDFFNLFAGIARFSPVLPVIGAPAFPRVHLGGDEGFGIDLYGAGGPRFQPVYVGDVADAVMAALDAAGAAGKTYELGGPATYSFKEIMQLVLKETGRKRFLMPLPYALAELQALFLQCLPKPLLTPDQVKQLRRDNVVSGGLPGLRELGIAPTAAEAILPTYLRRFRTSPREDTPQG